MENNSPKLFLYSYLNTKRKVVLHFSSMHEIRFELAFNVDYIKFNI